MLSFSQLLDKYIRESGLSNSLLAWKIGVSRITVSRWRNEEVKNPNCKSVLKIAELLKLNQVEQDELLSAAGCQSANLVSQSFMRKTSENRPIPGIPIYHSSQFFGRVEALKRIRHAWQNPSVLQHLAIIGERRSGKTSLLKYLQYISQTPATERRPDQPQGWDSWLPHDFQFVFVDFHLAALCQVERLLENILKQLNFEVPDPCDLINFSTILDTQLDKPTVILMDEIESALESPSLDAQFWHNLRYYAGNGKLGFVVTAHKPLDTLVKDYGKESPFFYLFSSLFLGPLTENEAQKLINSFSFPLTAKDIDWILQESGCHPALLQLFCDELLFFSEENASKIDKLLPEKKGSNTASKYLFSLPTVGRPALSQILQWQYSINAALKDNDVPKSGLEEAENFLYRSNSERCEVLAKKLGATEIPVFNLDVFKSQLQNRFQTHQDIFKLHLNDNLLINLSDCFLYFPPNNLSLQELEMRSQQGEMAFQVTIVISLNSEQQTALRPCGENPSTQCVVPNSQELTQLLLAPDPIKIFATLLANQLKITQISPYQVSEGVNKDITFFGRFQILAHIMNREPANYLLMGGRQIGKSSILKHIDRRYQNNPKIDCHYLVLSGASLQVKLAKAFGLPFKTDLETLLEALGNVPKGQYRLILIDEADLFVQAEMKNGYPTLSYFRSLSEEGRCYFIFAGFWDLYEAALLDYHSPIKNFGDPIIIGALEAEACQQLATQPMEMLGIHYADKHLVEEILIKTGQRANLIAIVCDEMLKNLDKQQRQLNQPDVTRALHSQAVQGALVGWRRLSSDEDAARLDRIIVCATITQGEFSLTDVMTVLDQHHYVYSTEQLNQSLARLELAFIIQRHNLCYNYSVPLFQEILREQDIKALLTQEFKTTPQ